MSNLALTYDEVSDLSPCSDDFRRAVKCLGGKTNWNGNKINAATARKAGVTFDMMVWLASSVARKDADVERRLRLWIADCAAHVLHIYEKSETSEAPRNAIFAARRFARGEIDAATRDAVRKATRDAARTATGPATRNAAWAAAWDGVARTATRNAAWAAAWDGGELAVAWDAEQDWQYDRLVLWLSEDEPEDWPLPARQKGGES